MGEGWLTRRLLLLLSAGVRVGELLVPEEDIVVRVLLFVC